MANSNLTKLFKYGREFPSLISELSSKRFTSNLAASSLRIKNVSNSVQASPTVFKALAAYANAEAIEHYPDCGIGNQTNMNEVAEIQSSPNTRDMCVVTRTKIFTGIYNDDTDVITPYTLGDSGKGGTVIFLAMMRNILKENELSALYTKWSTALTLDFETETIQSFESKTGLQFEDFKIDLAKMSDNIYHRTVHDANPKIEFPGVTANLGTAKITTRELENLMVDPNTVQGTFKYLVANGGTAASKNKPTLASFDKKYSMRKLTEEEELLVPQLDSEEWIVPQEAEKICNLISKTRNTAEPMRNFMLRGPAGTGKTKTTDIIARGLWLPKITFTCNAGTEILDFLGQVVPMSNDMKSELPTADDISFNLPKAYSMLTGNPAENMPKNFTSVEANDLLLKKTYELAKQEAGGFSFVETPFVWGLKNGAVIEIQEPTVIIQPGVLVGLNSLLEEQEGTITLFTGEKIKRHPDTVIVVTTNEGYRGCDALNQSVISRMRMVIDIDGLTEEDYLERAMKRVKFSDPYLAEKMAKAVFTIANHLKENDIDNSVCGVRELIAWMETTEIEGPNSVLENGKYCVINKASDIEEERTELFESYLEPIF
ncbi:MoxR-like ATPase [Lachnospiraceae bacterium PF1-22]